MHESINPFIPNGQNRLMLIFTYAAAGLGHLRVTDALRHGLPEEANPLLLSSQEQSIGFLHHLTSIHPLARAFAEWMQRGRPEELFTRRYRHYLRTHTSQLEKRLLTVIDQWFDPPETVLVVATHFGLAHQLAALKETLRRVRRVRPLLVLQVTDDSPQRIWYVAGADLIVVPSERTRTSLLEYGKHSKLPPVRIEVLPYPVSPLLEETLSAEALEQRRQQLTPDTLASIQIAIPVSGAAVGLSYSRTLIDALHQYSVRYQFQVISKESRYTHNFLEALRPLPYVTLQTAAADRETVERYEDVYRRTPPISLEVTKPSEQAFKALMNPQVIGGAILLFSQPIGRQEYDNLNFLERHHLLPSQAEQRTLWMAAQSDSSVAEDIPAQHWRGLRLPEEPAAAARFIDWCLRHGIFRQMLEYRLAPHPSDLDAREIQPDGVAQFWRLTQSLL